MGLKHKNIDRRLCVAPMMDWTDRHCRYLLRLIFPKALLYSEMLTTGAVLHGNRKKLLGYDATEHPLALQLGGADAEEMAVCAQIAEDASYDEININVGCPSDRVQSGKFGACLMAQPWVVAECVAAIKDKVDIPVSVKTRIGIDDFDLYDDLCNFISIVSSAGCKVFIIHARKAHLKGLNAKENREIPPLNYERVYHLKSDFPHLTIIINGGIKTSDQVYAHLEKVDGVMIGREIYQNPFTFVDAHYKLYGGNHPVPKRHDIINRYIPYIKRQLEQGIYLKHMARHTFGIFQGVPGAKKWRRYLSDHVYLSNANEQVLLDALEHVNITNIGFK